MADQKPQTPEQPANNAAAAVSTNVVDMKPVSAPAPQAAASAPKASAAKPKPAAKPAAKKAAPKQSAAKAKPLAKKMKAKKPTMPKAKPQAKAAAPKAAAAKRSSFSFFNFKPTFNPLFKPTFPSIKPMEDIMTKNNAQFEKLTQETVDFSRQQFDAMSKSYGILAKGYESLLRTTMELSQSAAEKQAKYAKEAMSCTSINQFAEMQSKVAQASFDDFMANATKISEMSTKVLTESAEPLNEQLGKAMQKMSEAA